LLVLTRQIVIPGEDFLDFGDEDSRRLEGKERSTWLVATTLLRQRKGVGDKEKVLNGRRHIGKAGEWGLLRRWLILKDLLQQNKRNVVPFLGVAGRGLIVAFGDHGR